MLDFFGHQDRARTNTKKLVGLFMVAVVAVICAVYVAVVGTVSLAQTMSIDAQLDGPWLTQWWNIELFLAVAGTTVVVVVLGSLYRVSQLSGGGRTVAEMLGGERLVAGDFDERTRVLRNVVEEMAIASGCPVPELYVLWGDSGINAFAAGTHLDNAVIGVTEGALDKLPRDELQGVIAHEFSHIVNGDMKLNIRLAGVIHGLVVIGLVGRLMLRSMTHRSSSRSRKGGGGVVAAVALGVALLIIGYIGVLCGRMIRAAVSRQREFLADAAAVQFTRNPKGLRSALTLIGQQMRGGRVDSANAESMSHLFFANALRKSKFMSGAFDTHPPLEERVKRLGAKKFEAAALAKGAAGARGAAGAHADQVSALAAGAPRGRSASRPARSHAQEQRASRHGTPSSPVSPGRGGGRPSVNDSTPDSTVSSIGQLDVKQLIYSHDLIESIAPKLREAAHDSLSAVALVQCFVLSTELEVVRKQAQLLGEHFEKEVRAEIRRLRSGVAKLEQRQRLPLLELMVPALRQLSKAQLLECEYAAKRMLKVDGAMTLFGYMVTQVVGNLVPGRRRRKKTAGGGGGIVAHALGMLALCAHFGHDRESLASAAFETAAKHLELPGKKNVSYQQLGGGRLTIEHLDGSLTVLRDHAKPKLKQQLLKACAHCVAFDNKVAESELEFLRILGEVLDCPIPPLPMVASE